MPFWFLVAVVLLVVLAALFVAVQSLAERKRRRRGIVIEPNYGELTSHLTQYQALEADLRHAGHQAEIRADATDATNRVGGAGPVWPYAYDVVVHVYKAFDDHLLDAIAGYIVARLTARGMRKRRAAILGPRGEVLREVELDARDAASTAHERTGDRRSPSEP